MLAMAYGFRVCWLSRSFGAAQQVVPAEGSPWSGLRFATTPLRCSAFSRVAKLAAFAALTPLKQLRRVTLRSALRAPTEGLRSSPPHRSPPPGTACRAEPFVFLVEESKNRLAKAGPDRSRSALQAPRSAGLVAARAARFVD
jgi:hypothetical protein